MRPINLNVNKHLKPPVYDMHIVGADLPRRFIDTLSLQVFCDRLKREGAAYSVVNGEGTSLTYY